MSRYAPPILALIAALFLLAACERVTTTSPYTGYLEEEIPPCTPVEGSSVDPCEPDVPWMSRSAYPGSELYGMRFLFGPLVGSHSYVTYIVLRGTFLPGTVRCFDDGNLFRPPPYHSESWIALESTKFVKCYGNVRVNAYVLGSGPPTLTLLVLQDHYSFTTPQEVVEKLRTSHERFLTEGGSLSFSSESFLRVPEGGIEGREDVLFIGVPVDTSAEAWEIYFTWGVEQKEDGTVIAVHPHGNYWRRDPSDYRRYRSQLEMELPAFKQAVTKAHQERIAEYDGRIGPDENLPMLVTDANQLRQFYMDTGAYNHPDGPPTQPPPPCGLVVSNQLDNPGLMLDCFALLAAKDTLRGTATLNWGLDRTIANWNGHNRRGNAEASD